MPTWESARAPAAAARVDEAKNGAEAVVELLVALGVEHAFGVMGGGIAPFCRALSASAIDYVHTRHEAGAAFAALEASLATDRLAVVFTTTGPGITNAITGLAAARCDGAKVLLVSAATASRQRGRSPCQETTAETLPAGLLTAGPLFDYARVLEHVDELAAVTARLKAGASGPGGFVAHLNLGMGFQTSAVHARAEHAVGLSRRSPPSADVATARRIAERMAAEPFFIYVGFGARHASKAVRELVERTGAPTVCSPRGKGIVPEDHPSFLGVTGLGGHPEVEGALRAAAPSWALVLGSRLGEGSSLWAPVLAPRGGFVHVDVDASVFGASYPDVPTDAVHAEIGTFLEALREQPLTHATSRASAARTAPPMDSESPRRASVRPAMLMHVLQRVVVDDSDAIVMAESGNSFMWATHHLRFREPGRYRVSTAYGSMGHMATGVLGAAMAAKKKAFALIGDGAMLMLSEVNTAVAHRTPAVWIVLNDACYGMVEQGIRSLGWETWANDIPRVDFARLAESMGARGIRVDTEDQLEAALRDALATEGPAVVDVRIDPTELAPSVANRAKSLRLDGDGGAR